LVSVSPTLRWNAARLRQLDELRAKRMSATEIAAELGDGLTRSAVLGKLFRMRLRSFGKRGPKPRALTITEAREGNST